jgi:hypothetical protein
LALAPHKIKTRFTFAKERNREGYCTINGTPHCPGVNISIVLKENLYPTQKRIKRFLRLNTNTQISTVNAKVSSIEFSFPADWLMLFCIFTIVNFHVY